LFALVRQTPFDIAGGLGVGLVRTTQPTARSFRMGRLSAVVAVIVLIGVAAPSSAQVYVPASAGDFAGFSNGDLAGQHGWKPLTTTPTGLQVINGKVVTLG